MELRVGFRARKARLCPGFERARRLRSVVRRALRRRYDGDDTSYCESKAPPPSRHAVVTQPKEILRGEPQVSESVEGRAIRISIVTRATCAYASVRITDARI